jgi:hypothetical protein
MENSNTAASAVRRIWRLFRAAPTTIFAIGVALIRALYRGSRTLGCAGESPMRRCGLRAFPVRRFLGTSL